MGSPSITKGEWSGSPTTTDRTPPLPPLYALRGDPRTLPYARDALDDIDRYIGLPRGDSDPEEMICAPESSSTRGDSRQPKTLRVLEDTDAPLGARAAAGIVLAPSLDKAGRIRMRRIKEDAPYRVRFALKAARGTDTATTVEALDACCDDEGLVPPRDAEPDRRKFSCSPGRQLRIRRPRLDRILGADLAAAVRRARAERTRKA